MANDSEPKSIAKMAPDLNFASGHGDDDWAVSGTVSGGFAEVTTGADVRTATDPSAALMERLRAKRLDQDPKDLHASLARQGQEMARNETSLIVSQMLQRSGLSLREIEKRYGFAPAMVSRWASGKLQSGAELASVKALAAALGYRVRLVLEERT